MIACSIFKWNNDGVFLLPYFGVNRMEFMQGISKFKSDDCSLMLQSLVRMVEKDYDRIVVDFDMIKTG